MSGLELGQMIGHGFAKLTGAQRDAGVTSPVAATASGSVVLPDGTEMMRSASGNIGIGVTPSPWNSAVTAMDFGLSGSISADDATNYVEYGNNFYRGSGGIEIYKSNGAACKIELQTDGSFKWNVAPSGTAGNPISFTQAMTLDEGGNLLVGTTSNPYVSKAVIGGSLSILGSQLNVAPGAGAQYEIVNRDGAGFDFYVNNAGTLATRIDAAGNLVMTGGGSIGFSNNTSTRAGDSGQYIIAADSNGLYQQAGGSHYLVTTAGGSTSDASLKTNVTPLARALERVEAIRGVNFEFIEQPLCAADQGIQLGVIAQEVEAQFPEIVLTGKDGTKTVRYDRLVAPLIEAVKELSAQNGALMARVAALEAAQAV